MTPVKKSAFDPNSPMIPLWEKYASATQQKLPAP